MGGAPSAFLQGLLPVSRLLQICIDALQLNLLEQLSAIHYVKCAFLKYEHTNIQPQLYASLEGIS